MILLLAAAVSVGYYVYSQSQSKMTQIELSGTTISAEFTTTNETTLMVTKITFAGVTLTVELATTSAEQEQGLSDRNSMPADQGMLFVFSQEAQWGFWMHEMRFPLDIIWFNASRQAVFIEQDLPPCTPSACLVYTPITNAMFVLEVNAGFVATNSVSLGESFVFV
jgi:hypothetical protein